MKKMRLLLGLAVVMMLSSATSYAQGRFGKDSADCVGYLNFYKDYYKQNNLKDAASLWRKAYSTCPPQASQFIFVDGRKIMTYLINNFKGDAAQKAKMVDTLLAISATRAEFYPKYAKSSKEFRLYDLVNYVKNDDALVLGEIRNYIKENGPNASDPFFVISMQKARALYMAEKISADDVLKVYTDLSPVLEARYNATKSDATKSAQGAFMDAFVTSGVANCENLVSVFSPRFDANPKDLSLVKTIAKLLSENECLDSELFLKSVTALNELEPSYNSSYLLYRLHNSKGNFEEALANLKSAIDSEESDDIKDGELMLDMATYYYKNMKNSPKAVAAAKEAMKLNPAVAGKANLLIGTIWGAQRCSGNEIEQRAKYWVAVDYLIRSKQDPETAGDAQELISAYTKYYPNVADAFMYDVKDKDSYTVSCGGLSATTTVRTTK